MGKDLLSSESETWFSSPTLLWTSIVTLGHLLPTTIIEPYVLIKLEKSQSK